MDESKGVARYDKSRKYITVTFKDGKKKFVYSDVFKSGFLTEKK